MTDAVCTPVTRLAPLSERDPAADRFVDLLECLADLLVCDRRADAADRASSGRG